MKYNIYINQYALADSGLDLQTCAVLDYLKCLCSTTSNKVVDKKIGDYFWVSLSSVISDMPLLGIKTTAGISLKIKKLKDTGFVETKIVRQKNSGVKTLMYLRLTDKASSVDFGENSSKLTAPSTTVNDSHQLQLTNHNTINHNTNIITQEDASQASPEKSPGTEEPKTPALVIEGWIRSSKIWLKIIGLFAKHRNLDEKLKTEGQVLLLIPKYRKVASELSMFSGPQIKQAFERCDEMVDRDGRRIDWTLFTVKSVLLK